ncbi:MAG: TldD/PmbA family protein [Candidatus Zixiibacteriota bacterium]|nr:MAG: TldD/PmbA family protein [candidate division Zixibacteria bacterium]
MIDQEILDIFKKALKNSSADQTELVCESEEFYLTRFAENLIHQNMGRSDSTIWCRAIFGKRIGVSRSNEPTAEGVVKLIKAAEEIAQNQKEDPDFQSLLSYPGRSKSSGFYSSIFEYSAGDRADVVSDIVRRAKSDSLSCAGTFQTSATSLAVVNSLGTENFARNTEYRFTLTASVKDGLSGWAQAAGRDVEKFDFKTVSQRALDKASLAGEPVALDPGAYTVILEPDAVANFLLFLAFLGFGGKLLHQNRSFMSGKIGEKIMGDNITITEDPFHPAIEYLPFDYEGVPRQKVTIIENGIARAGVYNSYYANLAGTQSTGHALQPDNSYGPYPKAMVIDPGENNVEDMISSTDYGIYITRFWYLNFLNPMRTMVTGYTRDGTFLIENGKITKPVVDMRIQQSMLEAFSEVETLSAEQRLIPQYGALMLVPFMKINNFNLTVA